MITENQLEQLFLGCLIQQLQIINPHIPVTTHDAVAQKIATSA